MNLKEYQQNALRTESKISELKINKDFIVLLFKLFVTVTDILDAIKKEVYYNNSKKMEKEFIPNVFKMEDLAYELKYAFSHRKDFDEVVQLDPRVFHGCLGVATEAGELLDVLVKHFAEGKSIDAVNVQEELADQSWYTAILNDALGLNWEEGLERNINKLRVRFPKAFSEVNANERNLSEERKALEGEASSPLQAVKSA